jgi:hypothetical protein
MKNFGAIALAVALFGCGGGLQDDGSSDNLDSARRHRCHSDADCKNGQVCVNGTCQNPAPPPPPPPPGGSCKTMDDCANGALCESGSCVAMACQHRAGNKTGFRAQVQITRYQGIIHGRNGDHEIAFGTVAKTLWVSVPSVVDTSNVELAMNVKSSIDPTGLPHEIPVAPGQTIEVEGEYISGATANAQGAAVVHFTHSTCGFVTIGSATYQ